MPNFFDRLSTAFKAFGSPDASGEAQKNLPHETGVGHSFVSTYTSWSAWDAARRAQLKGSSDPSASSLVMAGIRWLGNRLPEAEITIQEPDGEESKAVPNHALVKLFKRANPYMSGSTLWKAFAYSWIIKGDVYFIKWRDNSKAVTQLWYEPHWNVRPRWINDGQGAYISGANDDPAAFITYYEVKRGTEKRRVEVEDVIHFRDGIDPEYPRCGLSGIATILREILGDSEAADLAGRLLGSGGVPPFVLSIDDKAGTLKQKDIDDIKDRLRRQMSNKGSGEPLVTTNAKVEQLAFSPEELDLRVSRYLAEERFAAVTGIPLEVLQLGAGKEHSIYNNVSEARTDAAQGYLVPLWWHIAEELTVQLLPDFEKKPGRFVEHDISEVQALQEDQDSLHTRVGSDYQNGLITRAMGKIELGYDADTNEQGTGKDDVYFVRSGSSLMPVTEVEPEPEDTQLPEEVPTNGGRELPA